MAMRGVRLQLVAGGAAMTHLNNPIAIEWQRIGKLGNELIPVRLPARGMAHHIPDVIDDIELIGDRFRKLIEVYQTEVCGSFSEVSPCEFKQWIEMMQDGMNELISRLNEAQYDLEQLEEANSQFGVGA